MKEDSVKNSMLEAMRLLGFRTPLTMAFTRPICGV
jgi:hypothetical protein